MGVHPDYGTLDHFSRFLDEAHRIGLRARVLFQTYLLERALYELRFELNHRPAWVAAPLLDLPFLLTSSHPLDEHGGGFGEQP